MTQPGGGQQPRRRDRAWLLLILILVLLCLCLATPTLAKQPWGGFLKPIGDLLEQVYCKIPQLTNLALICPSGGRTPEEQACGTACIPSDPNACPFSLSCKVASTDATTGATLAYCWNDAACQNVPPPGEGKCGSACDVQKNDCAEGMVCLTAPDATYVCWSAACGDVPPPSGGDCYSACRPNAKTCDDGLSCMPQANGGYVCFGDSCAPPPSTGDCNQPCDPQKPDTCREGLRCAPNQAGAYVCWGGDACNPPPVTTGCFAPCLLNQTFTSVAAPSCDPGLTCTPQEQGGALCWNEQCGTPPPPTGGSCYESCVSYATGSAVISTCAQGLSCVQNPNNGSFFCFGDSCEPPPGGGCNAPCVDNSTCDPGLTCTGTTSALVAANVSVSGVCWNVDMCTNPPPTGDGCGVACTPSLVTTVAAAASFNPCAPGLSCQQEPDGGYVCWNGDICGGTPPPSGGYCNDPCNPQNPNCGQGLSCVSEPDGGYVCWNADICTQQPTGGRCSAPCGVGYPACAEGLTCVQEPDGAYICWNANICTGGPVTTPEVTTEPGGGPTDPCAKEACGDGYCSTCPVDQGCTADCPVCVCGNGVCQPDCKEDAVSCPTDCTSVPGVTVPY